MANKRQPTAGRPEGSKNPTASERCRRALPTVLDAVISRAKAGDAAAARLCLEIAQEPAKFPALQSAA